MIPGSNILSMALSVIARQSFTYKAYISRQTLAQGYDVTTYADPVDLTGSVQPVPRELFDQMGLDLQGDYIKVFLEKRVLVVERDVSGDEVIYNGDTYQVLSSTPWYAADGWMELLCAKVKS